MKYLAGILGGSSLLIAGLVFANTMLGAVSYDNNALPVVVTETIATSSKAQTEPVVPLWPLLLDTKDYDKRILVLAGYVPPAPVITTSTSTNESGVVATKFSTSTPASPLRYSSTTNVTIEGKRWPPVAVYPNGGAILPFKRILAYYGNFYSRNMGILGEYEPEEVLRRLEAEKVQWEAVDPTTPIQLAIEYIAMVAQAEAGTDGMYRTMMPDAEIEKAYALAQKAGAILIFDIQPGLSPIQKELPKFKKYLMRPDVHLAIDPEFSMKSGDRPGTVMGTVDARDVNYIIDYMAEIVKEYELPPKVLLVHRFTQNMLTNSKAINPTAEVQVVIVMDGWGSKDLKRSTYSYIIEPEPVQFAGVKIFYKNDLKPPSTGIFTPAGVLDLNPKPIYIQYH